MAQQSLFILAGEASGDLLGGKLIESINSLYPEQYQIRGIGGDKMQTAGCDIIVPAKELAIMGFWEVLTSLAKIKKYLNVVKENLAANPPDLLILIDFSGFNLRVAKIAKSLGIKVLFYVSPKIWAWHYSRIKKIKKYVDHMAVFFDFEVNLYKKEGVPVTLIGHPLLDCTSQVKTPERQNAKTSTIALLPGSRKQEIKHLMPTMIKASHIIRAQLPKAKFILPLASTIDRSLIEQFNPENIEVTTQSTQAVLAQSDAAIVCSGTATLETALYQVPMVIIYKLGWISYLLGRMLIKVKFIGLCNIVAQQETAKELIQHQASPAAIAHEALKLLQTQSYREHRLQQLQSMRSKLGEAGGSDKLARLIHDLK